MAMEDQDSVGGIATR